MSAAKKDKTFNVTIVDGKLILSLPDACDPVVWQMDLEKAQSAAFSVKENKKDKRFALVLRSDQGASEDIAEFEDKASAVDVLMETSSVMQGAHGRIKGGGAALDVQKSHVAAASRGSGGSDKAGAVLAVILVVILLGIWAMSASIPDKIGGAAVAGSSASSSGSASAPTSARESSGVAVSADDFLSNR